MSKEANNQFRFSWMEFSGSLGDLGLFIPLVVAMTIACELDIGVVLIFAGLLNIITGFLFRQPIPVQPMKAMAVMVISEGMMKEELFAAGILLGFILLLSSLFIDHINRLVPKAIVRGIQLGVGVKLGLNGLKDIFNLPLMGWDSGAMAVVIVLLLFIFLPKKLPGCLLIFLLGLVLLYFNKPDVFATLTFTPPVFELNIPAFWAFKRGFIEGVLPQLPLTLLNSVVAVCALSAAYFPGKGIAPRRMAASVGLMNILTVPFGGIPMCHGAGGLAAQFRFGARSGASVIMLGAMKIIVGLLFGSALFDLLQNYPTAILSTLLIFAGIELARSVQDLFGDRRALIVAVFTAGMIVWMNTFIGFACGIALFLSLNLVLKLKRT